MSAQPLEEAWSILKAKKRDPRLARAGVSGFNKPKRTPNHPKKSHIVVARSGGKVKTIRFGQKGAKTVTESNPTVSVLKSNAHSRLVTLKISSEVR